MKNIAKLVAKTVAVTILFCASGLLLRGQQKSVSVEGYVLDSACAFTKNLEKPISRECALTCAKAGSQLVILSDDGSIYWPIAETTPATGQKRDCWSSRAGALRRKVNCMTAAGRMRS